MPADPTLSAPPERGNLTVIVPMPPSYRGGTEEYAYQLTRYYSESRPVHVVTTTARWTGTANALSIGSATLERLPAREVLERPVVVGPAAARQLKRAVLRAGAVQLHMPFPWVERRVTAWARRAGIPTVLTYHMDAEFGENPQGWSSRLVTSAYRRVSAYSALSHCNAVVSNSRGYAQASPVLSRYAEKVRVIYQGVDLERLRASDGNDGGIPPRRPGIARVVFVGRIVAYKGIPDLIHAVSRLAAQGQIVELLIGGKGPQKTELEALVHSLRLGENVRFLGFVPDGAVGRLYADADVVVCPSISLLESTPITLQEAMAFGTPVIGTTLPGTEETVPDDGARGRLVNPHDVDGLARAIQELVAAGRPGGTTPARSWRDTAADYLALFDELQRRKVAG
ncbi:MAG: glycosyltransferase family 4 protein [Thermoplasmata archaeon]|nr:glycosyltransferase family 4 protein [Thermoplasmata archaeon]